MNEVEYYKNKLLGRVFSLRENKNNKFKFGEIILSTGEGFEKAKINGIDDTLVTDYYISQCIEYVKTKYWIIDFREDKLKRILND